MKKFVILFLILASCLTAFSQAPPMQWRHSNLVLFAGIFSEPDSNYIKGNWKGVYADLALYRSFDEKFNLGLWGLYARPKWENTADKFSSSAHEFAVGLTGGYYEDMVGFAHAFYAGGSIGYKHASEKGVWLKDGGGQSLQNDHMIVGTVNLNLLKHEYARNRWLPRTQLIVQYQSPQKSEKVNLIKKVRTEVVPWDKTSAEIMLKQSIYDIPLSYTLFLQPKVGYQHSRYYGPNANAWIVELSLHKIYADDFFTISLMSKKDVPEAGHNPRNLHFIMGSINFIALFKTSY